MKSSLFAIAIATLLAGVSMAETVAPDRQHIQHLLMSMFDKPDSRLTVAPVIVAGDYAVAGWVQTNQGGRALLRRRSGEWALILCSGDSLKAAKHLEQIGVPHADAAALAAQIADQEAKLPAAHVALLSTFEGTVMMDGSGAHPPQGEHGGGHKH